MEFTRYTHEKFHPNRRVDLLITGLMQLDDCWALRAPKNHPTTGFFVFSMSALNGYQFEAKK